MNISWGQLQTINTPPACRHTHKHTVPLLKQLNHALETGCGEEITVIWTPYTFPSILDQHSAQCCLRLHKSYFNHMGRSWNAMGAVQNSPLCTCSDAPGIQLEEVLRRKCPAPSQHSVQVKSHPFQANISPVLVLVSWGRPPFQKHLWLLTLWEEPLWAEIYWLFSMRNFMIA